MRPAKYTFSSHPSFCIIAARGAQWQKPKRTERHIGRNTKFDHISMDPTSRVGGLSPARAEKLSGSTQVAEAHTAFVHIQTMAFPHFFL